MSGEEEVAASDTGDKDTEVQDELQVIRKLAASFKSLHEMLTVVHEDHKTISNNMQKLTEINKTWEKIFEQQAGKMKKKRPYPFQESGNGDQADAPSGSKQTATS